jgi:hypothetical protein
MNFQRYLVPLATVILIAWAWQSWGWLGVAMVVSAGVMWTLLHFTRLVQTMKRASQRPIGFVDSAVMLNAKLKTGMNLMHVIAMTRALGQPESEKDAHSPRSLAGAMAANLWCARCLWRVSCRVGPWIGLSRRPTLRLARQQTADR